MRRDVSSGFTLVEMLVTMAVLAILVSLAAPGFGRYFADQHVKGSAGDLANDLQFARMESVQRNAPVTVALNGSGYTISAGANTIKVVTLTAGSVIASGSTMSAVFDPVRAMATLTNGPDVIVGNSGTSSTLRVTLTPMGRVGVCSPSGAMKGYDAC